jgi:hypothetical protein
VCLEVTMLQVWRWTPWICLNWRRHHDMKFALSNCRQAALEFRLVAVVITLWFQLS